MLRRHAGLVTDEPKCNTQFERAGKSGMRHYILYQLYR